MEAVVRSSLPGRVLVAGDFNAKSAIWGCPAGDRRGEVLLDWAGSLGLTLLNEGNLATCVRPQRRSIDDVGLPCGPAHGGWLEGGR